MRSEETADPRLQEDIDVVSRAWIASVSACASRLPWADRQSAAAGIRSRCANFAGRAYGILPGLPVGVLLLFVVVKAPGNRVVGRIGPRCLPSNTHCRLSSQVTLWKRHTSAGSVEKPSLTVCVIEREGT